MAVRILTAIVSGVWLSMAPTTSALSDEELVSSQFDFGEGTPFKGQIMLGDIQVVLRTTNTEPYGRTSFRDQVTGIPAEILFCFNQRVGEFRISFSRILAGEILRYFSAGPPQAIEGDLFDQGDLTYTVPAEVGDYGKGTLIWRKLNARNFGFVIDNPRGWATAVDGFAVSAATAGEDAIADDRRVDAPDFASFGQLADSCIIKTKPLFPGP
jgi:hypothetical protein